MVAAACASIVTSLPMNISLKLSTPSVQTVTKAAPIASDGQSEQDPVSTVPSVDVFSRTRSVVMPTSIASAGGTGLESLMVKQVLCCVYVKKICMITCIGAFIPDKISHCS